MKDAATFVKERATAAANSVSQSVKTAAQDMGTAARETALAAAVSLELYETEPFGAPLWQERLLGFGQKALEVLDASGKSAVGV